MDVSRFTCDELILAGVALLLAIDLLFVPWFDISIGIAARMTHIVSVSTGRVAACATPLPSPKGSAGSGATIRSPNV